MVVKVLLSFYNALVSSSGAWESDKYYLNSVRLHLAPLKVVNKISQLLNFLALQQEQRFNDKSPLKCFLRGKFKIALNP